MDHGVHRGQFAGHIVNISLGQPPGLAPAAAALWVASHVCLVFGAISPSRVLLGEPASSEPTLLRSRLTMLGLALSAIPVSTALRSGGGQLFPVAGTTVITVLALWRLGRLLHDRERRSRHQASLLEMSRLAAVGDPQTRYPGVAAALRQALGTPAVAVVDVTADPPRVLSAAGRWPADLTPEESRRLGTALPAAPGDYRLRDMDYWLRPYGTPVDPSGFVAVTRGRDDPATVDGAVQLLSTGVRRIQAEERLRHASLHDALTDLPNRLLLQRNLLAAASRAHRNGSALAVVFVDLDGFKNVNDTLGHAAGDELLMFAAHRLLGCVRPSDTVARISGDEFVLVAEGVDERIVRVIAQRVVACLAEPMPVSAASRGSPRALEPSWCQRRVPAPWTPKPCCGKPTT